MITKEGLTTKTCRGFYLGVDLGQVSDYTALALLKTVEIRTLNGKDNGQTTQEWSVRFLERIPLGTSYPDICKRIAEVVNNPKVAANSNLTMVVDATGVGLPVVNMLKEIRVPSKLTIIPVMLTSGMHVTHDHGCYHVPKRDLMGSVKMLLGERTLKIADGVPFQDVLLKELDAFRVKVNVATGHDSYEAWRDRDHDDLVLAVAFAGWYALWRKQHKPLVIAATFGTRKSPWKI
jgi:hypothetical protein